MPAVETPRQALECPAAPVRLRFNREHQLRSAPLTAFGSVIQASLEAFSALGADTILKGKDS